MLNHILELLKEHNIFLTGGGGVGKSYMTTKIMHIYSKNNKRVVALGSTGISAVGIGGVSIHSFFKFGICSNYLELNLFDKKQKDKLKHKIYTNLLHIICLFRYTQYLFRFYC